METLLRVFSYLIITVPSLYPAWIVLEKVKESIFLSLFVAMLVCSWILIVAAFVLFVGDRTNKK